MIYEMLNREMIFPNLEASGFEDVLRKLGGAANKVVELCRKNGIDVEICQVRISEIESNLPADLIVPTSKVKRDFGVSLITGMPFISGMGVEKTEAAILKVLRGE